MKTFTLRFGWLPLAVGVLFALGAVAWLQTLDAAGRGSRTIGPPAAGAPAPNVVLPRGVYLYREQLNNDVQFDQALGVPGIDGMAVVLDWSTIQPSPGSFETGTIDSQLALARKHNLPVELVVRAGRSVPAWVARPAQLKLAYSPHQGLGACSPVHMPPPWDPTYQSAFRAIVKRTADYVRAQGIAISVVKLTGINATTEELRLPAETQEATRNCPGGPVDDVAVWDNVAHYTPTQLVQAFDRLASAFAEISPGMPITVALIPRWGFPPIDDAHRIVRGRQIQTLNDSLLRSLVGGAARSLPGRFIVQFDFLMYDMPANPEVVELARAYGLPLAWQTNLWRGNVQQGAGCGGSPGKGTVCTDAEYLGLLEEGIHPAGGEGPSAQGLYVEAFAYDVLAHQAAIEKAHQEMVSRTAPSPGRPPIPSPCPPGVRCQARSQGPRARRSGTPFEER